MAMLTLFIVVLLVVGTVAQYNVKIGLLHNRENGSDSMFVGYLTSAAAVDLAVDRLKREHFLDGINLTFLTKFDDCIEYIAAQNAIEFFVDEHVDVIIGPTCNRPALIVSIIADFYNLPVYNWGMVTTSEILDDEIYPTAVTMSATSNTIAAATNLFFRNFGWSEFSVLSAEDEKCPYLLNDLLKETVRDEITEVTLQLIISDYSSETFRYLLQRVKDRSRIIAVCLPDESDILRTFMLAAMDEGMITDEFAFVFVGAIGSAYEDPDADGKINYVWEDFAGDKDKRDDEALEAFKKSFFVVSAAVSADEQITFKQTVMKRMLEPPYNCGNYCIGLEAADFAPQLHDALYLYVRSVNQTIQEGQPEKIRDGRHMMDLSQDEFDGESGRVVIDRSGTRCPYINLINLSSQLREQIIATISICEDETNYTSDLTNDRDIFPFYTDNNRPLSVPRCGFLGNSCPIDFTKDYLWVIILASLLVFVSIACALAAVLYSIRQKRSEERRLDEQWLIPSSELVSVTSKKAAESQRSLQSSYSTTSTKITLESRTETTRFVFYSYQKEAIAAEKHEHRPLITKENTHYLRKMREIQNDNLNRFMGLSIDGALYLSCWRYCSRGSIKDVMTKTSITMDGFFVNCLIRDIVNGLHYIHGSFLKHHGQLTSSCCLIDDRWQVKISAYGLPFLRSTSKRTEQVMLYTAPEILRDSLNMEPSKEGDIYSLAIIMSEMIGRTSVWNLENRSEDADEILFMVKKGGKLKMRPDLTPHEMIDINPAVLALCRDCWEEDPKDRPTIQNILNMLKSLNHGRSDNLMDHVFKVLEDYATTLEEEVEERMKELTDEKKKSDVLLYRMLPMQVADKLKAGQSVHPEGFECVTLFFSDVVSFTTLASKCTPLQVVTLLNELYTIFDAIIEKNSVYKVETIGDGYLCVSGLPHRNGTEHIKNICNMAIELQKAMVFFRVPHLPSERVYIRIGVHTGAVVTGVVGLTMPRYCLFGDTVNVASRMESNGKAGQIHLSADSNALLTMHYPEFHTEPRGEVIVKGQGVMSTFWLIFQ